MDKGECNPSSCNLGNDGRVIRDRVELRSRSQAAFLWGGHRDVWCWQILLQKSKIEEPKNLAKVDSSMFSLRQGPSGIDTAAGGRSGAKRCGPSRRRVQNTQVSLKDFTGQSKETFSTPSRDERTSP
jgi:hypothetical protein